MRACGTVDNGNRHAVGLASSVLVSKSTSESTNQCVPHIAIVPLHCATIAGAAVVDVSLWQSQNHSSLVSFCQSCVVAAALIKVLETLV